MEYDPLPALSQQAGRAEKAPLCEGAAGHGCGHNLLGAGSFAAAVALKDYCLETGLRATVKYFGCPAEEDGGGKVFFARAGYFDKVDAVFAWHPLRDARPTRRARPLPGAARWTRPS